MMSAFQLGRISLKAHPRLPLLHLFDGVSDLCGHEGYRITEEPFSLHSGEGAAVTQIQGQGAAHHTRLGNCAIW